MHAKVQNLPVAKSHSYSSYSSCSYSSFQNLTLNDYSTITIMSSTNELAYSCLLKDFIVIIIMYCAHMHILPLFV